MFLVALVGYLPGSLIGMALGSPGGYPLGGSIGMILGSIVGYFLGDSIKMFLFGSGVGSVGTLVVLLLGDWGGPLIDT